MRKAILFIAMSLDGYIADIRGGVDWLKGQGEEENFDSYAEFAKSIDTILMGFKTYHQIITELSFNEWIYKDFATYIFTHNKLDSLENVHFIAQNPIDLLKKLKAQKGKDIWICGGANLASQFIRKDCIDRYYISIIPILLGSGMRLFEYMEQGIKLKLLHNHSYNGIVELIYERR